MQAELRFHNHPPPPEYLTSLPGLPDLSDESDELPRHVSIASVHSSLNTNSIGRLLMNQESLAVARKPCDAAR